MSEKKEYSPEWDAYYNPDTGEWIEDKCTDENCAFCKDRPDKFPITDKLSNKNDS